MTRLLVITMLILFAPAAFGCSVCWGNPNDPMVKSANAGVWVLLGIVAFVQLGFVALFWSFWKRGKERERFKQSLHVIEGGHRS